MYSLAPSTSALMTKTPPLKMICVPKDTVFLSLKKKLQLVCSVGDCSKQVQACLCGGLKTLCKSKDVIADSLERETRLKKGR